MKSAAGCLESVPKLLVSVRNAAEARVACQAGADILDIKEPDVGSLGAARPEVISECVRTIRGLGGNIPLSAACGELADWDATRWHSFVEGQQAASRPDFLKIGLAGLRGDQFWRRHWRELREEIARVDGAQGTGTSWVAVVYVDAEAAFAPGPREVVQAGLDAGCAGMLFDTFTKGAAGGVFEWMSSAELDALFREIRGAGLFCALAGQLRMEELPRVCELKPDIIAVRSAVCENFDRTGALDGEAVALWRRKLEQIAGSLPVGVSRHAV